MVAENPDVPHPGLVPSVTSFKILGCAYSVGFKNSTDDLLRLSRTSLMIVPRPESRRGCGSAINQLELLINSNNR